MLPNTRDGIFTELIELLRRQDTDLDVDAIRLDDEPFAAHGVESMMLLRLIAQAEHRFGLLLDDVELLSAYSFEGLVDTLVRKARLTGAAPAHTQENFLASAERRAVEQGSAGTLRILGLGRSEDVLVTHENLLRAAVWWGKELPDPGDGTPVTVLLATVDTAPTLLAFFAAMGRGARPLVVPAPRSLGGMDAWHARMYRLLADFSGPTCVAVQEGLPLDVSQLPSGVPVVTVPSQVDAWGSAPLPQPGTRTAQGDDVAFLQMTSASTGAGRLVAISHTNVCANLTAMGESIDVRAGKDLAVSWLPLYHDMGLLGGALFPFYAGFPVASMKPTEFVKRPGAWIRALSEHRATFTGGPNFALEYAALAVQDEELTGVDLSGLRRMAVAAEPIRRPAMQKFVSRYAPYGFRPDAFVPGLGLAESTIATTTRVDQDLRYVVLGSATAEVGRPVRVLAQGYVRHPAEPPVPLDGDAPPAGPGTGSSDVEGVSVFALGVPVPGLTVDLRDDSGAVLEGESVVGEVAVSGQSVSVGYYDPVVGKPVPFEGGLLMTGDLGFMHEGELFLLERRKNVIIRRGANYLAALLEQQVADVLGVPADAVAVLESELFTGDGDIHAVLDHGEHLAVPSEEQRRALRALDLPIDVLTLCRGFAIPRTTSGKKRYHVCRSELADGGLAVARSVDLRTGAASAG